MASDNAHALKPTRRLWVRFVALVPLLIIMIIGCRAYIHQVGSTYAAWTPAGSAVDFSSLTLGDVACETPGVVKPVAIEYGTGGSACVTFESLADGQTNVTLGSGNQLASWNMRVQDGVIIADGVNFSGWESIHLCVCLFLAVLSALFASVLVQLARQAWFGYEMVASGGGLLFCLFQCLLFLVLYFHGSLLSYANMAYLICESASYFVMASLVPMAVLAVLVSVSNISLILHEGMRPVNLLGIAISIVWLAVMALWVAWPHIGAQLNLSFDSLTAVDSIIAVGIAFGVCLLLSTMLCAWAASRHEPARNADYLIVLGCGIREDGTPSPILAERVKRALAFDRKRTAAGDASATFVPSGGQGPDEIMSEAQSMSNYLQDNGVAPQRIAIEDRSTTTNENMAFSRAVIEDHAGRDVEQVSVAFSTTNYHVFRGYVCAHDAGMAAEGMGAKTRAYFWPNAFLREFAGLLAAQWKSILQTFLIIAVVYAVAEYMLVLA